jgi:hypothetical protein
MATALPLSATTPAEPLPPGAVPPETAAAERAQEIREQEIRIYGHSNMFYWWPVWVTGFIMAALTYMDGHVLVVMPEGSQERTAVVSGEQQPQDVVVAPKGKAIPPLPGAKEGDNSPGLRIATNNNLGVVFVGVLLLTIVVSNYIFRGLVSMIVLAFFAVIGLLFALLNWWDPILSWLGGLDIRMNAEGYLAVSIPLFLLWVFTTFIYDHYTYMIVTAGQVRIRESIGDGEIAVDSSGLLLDKKRNDIFRHWLVGLGAGDLHVKTGGPSNVDFQLPNVLFIGSKLSRIQNLLREKQVEGTVV